MWKSVGDYVAVVAVVFSVATAVRQHQVEGRQDAVDSHKDELKAEMLAAMTVRQGLEADRKELKTGLQPLRDVMAELRQELADVKDAKPRLKAMEAELQQLRKEVIEQQKQFSGLLNDLRQQESAAYSAA